MSEKNENNRVPRAASGQYQFPEELTTVEAADILGVSTDTVLRLKRAGLLEYRDAAAPGQRARYRFTLESVSKLRTEYTRDVPVAARESRQSLRRRRPAGPRRSGKYITIHDGD